MDIEKFRIRKNMSVADLAGMLGVSQAGVYNYKYGKSKPSYEAIEKLLTNGATLAEIFNDELEAIVLANAQVSQKAPLTPAEIVRQGLLDLALAKQNQG